MAAKDYGRAFALWRRNVGADWDAYTRHTFVEQLRTGDLPEANFLHYLRQDYVFLIHFSRAWALAAAKAETLDEMKTTSATLHGLVHVEMPMHIKTCSASGIDAATLEATPEAPANLAYTRFVLEAGYSGDLLDLLAALAPCVLGYGEIGARLEGSGGPYGDWIDTYAGREYQELCEEVGTLIDRSLTRRFGPGWAELPRFSTLSNKFATATRLEIGFWDMGLTHG